MLLLGLPLYREAIQKTLREATDRIMEQATTLDVYARPEGEHCSATNVTEFVAASYESFKSYVDNLYELSPTLGLPFENIDSLNTKPGKKPSFNGGTASKLFASLSRSIRWFLPSKRWKKRSLHDMKDLRRDPDSARYRSNRSSGSAGSSDFSSVFTRNGYNSSGQPISDSLTSTYSQEHQRDTGFGSHQIIMVRNYLRQSEEPHLGLFDSGSSECFIVRDAVDKLNLNIDRLSNGATVELLGKVEFRLSEYVEPNWRLQQGRRWHQGDKFFVVDDLPNDYHMIIGTAAYSKMGIQLSSKASSLVAFLNGHKGSSKGLSFHYASVVCMSVNWLHLQAVAHQSSPVTPYNVETVLHTGVRRRGLSNEITQLQEDLLAEGSHHIRKERNSTAQV